MTQHDPLRGFIDTLSHEQRAAFLCINRTRATELQAALGAATAALTKLYAEPDGVSFLVHLLERAPAPLHTYPPHLPSTPLHLESGGAS